MKAITKAVTGKHWWPAGPVAALAIVAILTALAILAEPGREPAEAQGLCETASGAVLQRLIEAGVCAERTPLSSTSGSTPLPPPTAVPTLPPPTPVPTLPPPTPVPTLPPANSVLLTPTPAPPLSPSPAPTPTAAPILTPPATPATASLMEGNNVIAATTDTVEGHAYLAGHGPVVSVYGLISAEGASLDEARSSLADWAATIGANAILDFRWASDHGARIAYGTAVLSMDFCDVDPDTGETLPADSPCIDLSDTTYESGICSQATGNTLEALSATGVCTQGMPERTLPGAPEVIVATTDAVPMHRLAHTHGLVAAESDDLDEAYSSLVDLAAAAGANAIVDFRWVTDHSARIAYGTAVTIE